MQCGSEKIIKAEVSGHASEHVNIIHVFHDINSILYTITNIPSNPGILLKVSHVFRSGNLPFFTLTSIHSIRKSTKKKKEIPKQGGRQKKIKDSNRSKDR